MIVCLCRNVSEHAIRSLVAAGARCPMDIARRCGAGADCGACCWLVESMVSEAAELAGSPA
ncbi:MAG TPA: (2Fe-2S)-binding protein [Methylomirabilota bacterium]